MAGEEFMTLGSESISGGPEAIIGLIASMFLIFLVISVVMYVFMGFAFMSIAKKAKLPTPGLAWIPGVGPLIIAYQASKMHWWPWLLLIGSVIPFLNFFTGLAFMVFAIIWLWKTFEAVNKPGWFALLSIIPIVNFIVIGIAAWSKD